VATDDLHAPLGLDKPVAGRPVVHSVAAAVLGIATAAIVIGAAAWYEPFSRSSPQAATPQTSAPHTTILTLVKPDSAVSATAPATPRVQVTGAASPPARPLPQVTGAIPPAAALEGGKALDQRAAPASTDRIITIIDGRSGARQEVRIPATSEAAGAPPPDPGLADLMRGDTVLDADDTPEPLPPPSRAKPSAPQKRAKPGPAMSTNSAPQAPLR
jgi:hypothetical protein